MLDLVLLWIVVSLAVGGVWAVLAWRWWEGD